MCTDSVVRGMQDAGSRRKGSEISLEMQRGGVKPWIVVGATLKILFSVLERWESSEGFSEWGLGKRKDGHGESSHEQKVLLVAVWRMDEGP